MSKTLDNIINLIVGLILIILSLRLVLRFFGANPNVDFTQFVYNTSGFFLAPFRGIFPVAEIEGATFEFSTLFTIIIYLLVSWILSALIYALSGGKTKEEVVVEKRKVE